VGELKEVETVFGYHIILVTGKTIPLKKVKLAVVDRKIEPIPAIQIIYTKPVSLPVRTPAGKL